MLDEVDKEIISLPGKLRDDQPNSMQMSKEHCLTIAGIDVEALFPSLEDVEVARKARQAVEEAETEFHNVNYDLAMKYLLVTGG